MTRLKLIIKMKILEPQQQPPQECTICLDPISCRQKKRKKSSVFTTCCCGWVHKHCLQQWSDRNLVFLRCPRCNTPQRNERMIRVNLLLRKWVEDTFLSKSMRGSNPFQELGYEETMREKDIEAYQEIREDSWVLHLTLFGNKGLTLILPPFSTLKETCPRLNLFRLHAETGFMNERFTRIWMEFSGNKI